LTDILYSYILDKHIGMTNINHPKMLVAGRLYDVVITTNIHMNRRTVY